ncbi:MAG: hypothetical protein ABII90_00435 [Bacteroidota bacterium]
MKKLILILLAIFTFNAVFSADFITELKLSIARSQKGSKVEYILHFPNGDEKVFTAIDFAQGRLVERDGVPLYFELYEGGLSKKHNIMISLQNAIYYEMDIIKINDQWDYSFHFYY